MLQTHISIWSTQQEINYLTLIIRMKDTEKLLAIIPAAGLGLRFGSSTPKQYGQILGQPMIYYSISTLSANRKVESIYVVLSPSDKWFNMYDWGNFKKKLNNFLFLIDGGRGRVRD